jgi:type II secretory pathway pseudopilin PulG
VVAALDAGQVTTLGIGIIVALIVIGVIISLIVTAIVVRIVVAVAVVVLAFVVWQQRNSIEHRISEHKCSFSFFGVHLGPPDHLKRICD